MRGEPTADFQLPPIDAEGVEVWRDVDGSTAAIGFRRGDQHVLYVPTVGSFSFGAAADITLSPAHDVSEETVQDAFGRIVLPLASQLRGRQVLHASAVVMSGGVVALCGRSGQGKSTLAYGLGRRGHRLWGDDAVAFTGDDDGGLVVDPLPFRMRLRPASADWFDDPAHLKGQEQGLPWSGGSDPVPFRALFVLERAEPEGAPPVHVDRLSPAEAFPLVLPHAYYLALSDLELNRALLTAYLELADRLPVFRLRYTPRLELVDQIAAGVEDSVATL